MLTRRQQELLEIIIREFVESAEAVGSIDLPRKYELDVSPATVRNEMAKLAKLGYLDKPHASSGRVPTTMAFKYFLQELLEDMDELDVRSAAVFGEDLFQKRFNIDHLMLSAVKALNQLTENAAVALIEDKIYHSGLNSLLNNPEFHDLYVFKQILAILEDYSQMAEIFSRYKGDDDIKVLIGEETGRDVLADSAVVFSRVPTYSGREGYIAIFGPNRMSYRKVIPSIKYVSGKISEILHDWRVS